MVKKGNGNSVSGSEFTQLRPVMKTHIQTYINTYIHIYSGMSWFYKNGLVRHLMGFCISGQNYSWNPFHVSSPNSLLLMIA